MGPTVVAVFGINPFRIGGVEIYTRELARQLEAQGSKLVAVFSRLPQGQVAEYLTAPNLQVEAIAELEQQSPMASLRPMARILRRHRAQILHLQFVGFISGFPWVARLCGVRKVFFTAQGSDPMGFQVRRAAAWKRLLARAINAPLNTVFCISEYTKRSLVGRDLFPSDKFTVVYNSIDPPALERAGEQATRFRERFGIPADREVVTQVSWIIPEKGVPQLLEAAQQVLAQWPTAHFAIVGRGAQEAEYREKAAELGIAAAITWTGLIENPMEEGVYAATDIFCLASQWQEAFGWVLAEAMAFQKPAVGTAVGGIPEVIDDGVTGLLVDPPEDSAQLARQLLRLLQNPDLRQRMGEAGRRRVEQRFDLKRNIAQIVQHYSS